MTEPKEVLGFLMRELENAIKTQNFDQMMLLHGKILDETNRILFSQSLRSSLTYLHRNVMIEQQSTLKSTPLTDDDKTSMIESLRALLNELDIILRDPRPLRYTSDQPRFKTVKQFVATINDFKSIPDWNKIIIFCYYLQEIKKQDKFTEKDVESCFNHLDLPIKFSLFTTLVDMENKGILLSKGYSFFTTGTNYRLSSPSVETAKELLGSRPLLTISKTLEGLPSLLQDNSRDLLLEALTCLRTKAWKATIILVWILTIEHLQDYVMKKKLVEFNEKLSKHNVRYKDLTIIRKEDFSYIKESDLISILEKSGVITKEQNRILVEKLGIRNTCAHPSQLKLTESKVISYIEDLIYNIVKLIN